MSDQYDLVVIGGGPGGLTAAETAARLKKKVLILEKDGWGGTCTHRGCIPTKAFLTCSRFFTDLKKIKRLGVNLTGAAFDFAAMKKHREQTVKVAALGAQKILSDAGVETRQGNAEILSPGEVKLSDASGQEQLIAADKILVAWGSVPQILPGISTSPRILTSDDILDLSSLPASMIIAGGSFIGVEYATVFAELGVKIILVELLDRILPLEDDEAAALLGQELARLGISVYTSTRLLNLKESPSGVVMQVQKNEETLEMRAECALLCTGRKPLLHRDQLDKLGIAFSPAGIRVDEKMRTNVPGIYAVGDVTGGMMLAHRASAQARVAAADMFGGAPPAYNENFIPSVVYSHPPIARVGYTEKRARQEGMTIDVIKSNYSANIMARAELMGQGFVKAVFAGDTIIGATIVGDHAGDLIAPLTLAVVNRMTRRQLQSWVLPHPTLSEIFTTLTV